MLSAFIEWVFKGFWQRFQLKGRFSGQWLDTWKFMISFLYRQARVTNKEIFKESNNLLSLYSKDFTKDLKSELRTFAHKLREEIKEIRATIYLVGMCWKVNTALLFLNSTLLFFFVAILVTVPNSEICFTNLKLI